MISVKNFCFTVDDNVRFLKELTESRPDSLFDHPYMAVYKRLHEAFGLKVQLNLFYRLEDFDLSQMTAAYREEWRENASWLRLSFHSDCENVRPYETSDYEEVYGDCAAVQREILRFASPKALAQTTTVHYCQTTADGLRALADNGVRGLLGLYGTAADPHTSYGLSQAAAARVRSGEVVWVDGIAHAPIDIVLNGCSREGILQRLDALSSRDALWVMIHEQYFYADYQWYQPDFEAKLQATFAWMAANGYQSRFFEELL